jgi:type II secretory pathway pseudopilin PulG
MRTQQPHACRKRRNAFTMVELAVTTAMTVVVFVVALPVFISIYRSWHGVELRMEADRDVNMAMNRLVYGSDGRLGLRTASGVTVASSGSGWTMTYSTGGTTPQTNSIVFNKTNKTLILNPGSRLLGSDVSLATVLPQTRSLIVTLRVDRVDGPLRAARQIGTEVSFRNM